jgi:hypothetical protein
MRDDDIRIGQLVKVTDASDGETLVGVVESGHMEEWFVRTDEGELTGPWVAEEFTYRGYRKM